jgi:hypothetical protein
MNVSLGDKKNTEVHSFCSVTEGELSYERGDLMPASRNPQQKRWSRKVTEESHALDLEAGVFSKSDPRSIARSLKRSAERSTHRKSDPYRSAMSMLTFYINRAGKKLSKTDRSRLETAKNALRDLYGKPRKAT